MQSENFRWDYLQFYIDGELKDEISGAVGWQKKRYALAAGEHTLFWRYIKDGSVSVKTLAYPKTLSFWWAVSSEPGYDYLEFYIDGVFVDRISGGFTWQKKSYALAAGTHTLYWRYIKDSSVNVGADAGYVDYVRIV